MIEEIYGLYVDDNESHIIYVGRAKCRFKRLKKHLYESKRGSSKKCTGIRQLLESGHIINVLLLETVDLSLAPSDAEETWIINIEGAGCTTLLNGKAGDTDRYEPLISYEEVLPWTIDDLDAAVWSKNHIGVNKGEWGTCVRGVSLYRKGWSKLRIVTPLLGNIEIAGMVWEMKIKNLIRRLNEALKF